MNEIKPAKQDVNDADCLLVLGMHRSGLSALADVVSHTGIHVRRKEKSSGGESQETRNLSVIFSGLPSARKVSPW